MQETQKLTAVAMRTRGRVIAATVDLIYELGLDNLTHRKIAERAGVPLGTTTYHFDSLAQLIELAIQQELASDSQRRNDVLNRAEAGLVKSATLIDLVIPSSHYQTEHLSNVYMRLSEIQFNRDFRHLVKNHQLAVESDIAKYLEQSGVDPSHAGTVLALLDGLLLQWLIYEKSFPWLRKKLDKALRDLGVEI